MFLGKEWQFLAIKSRTQEHNLNCLLFLRKIKGRKYLEGPSEINQQSDQCAAGILSEQVTTDANLGYPFGDEDEEEEEVTMLNIEK